MTRYHLLAGAALVLRLVNWTVITLTRVTPRNQTGKAYLITVELR